MISYEDYDYVYTEVEDYNSKTERKFIEVDKIFETYVNTNMKIIDLGCGKGHYLRRYISKGYNMFGIEPSNVCCKTFLTDVRHENIDILEYAKKDIKYDFFICMDVLEHIYPRDIDDTIESIKKMSSFGLFGIANHKEILKGKTLHLINQPKQWWKEKLDNHFKKVDDICTLYENMYFMYLVNNL